MGTVLYVSDRLYDAFEEWWEGSSARLLVAQVLVGGFFVSLVLIEAKRQGWLPEELATAVSTNHFVAIDVAFTLFLVVELVGLIVGLATSVADTAGKQFEVFSLILLRQSFKELVSFTEEPIQWTLEGAGREAVQLVMVDATGALLIFATMGLFYTLQKHQPITESETEQRRFVRWKKLISNVLLVVLLGLGVNTLLGPFVEGAGGAFFDTFYTVLIFSDVLIVLISLRYSVTYHVVFRNSGFAAATVMIRLALAGPRYLDVVLGVAAALFNVGVAAVYNYVAPAVHQSKERNVEKKGAVIPLSTPPNKPEEEPSETRPEGDEHP
ncbi:MAG: hypothetical protein R6T83_08880 [Salinibacter sp.]